MRCGKYHWGYKGEQGQIDWGRVKGSTLQSRPGLRTISLRPIGYIRKGHLSKNDWKLMETESCTEKVLSR